jgi:signal transduction histidine kinase/FixJ family two-component response regulator
MSTKAVKRTIQTNRAKQVRSLGTRLGPYFVGNAPELAMAAASISGVALGIWILATAGNFSPVLTGIAIVLTLTTAALALFAIAGFREGSKRLKSLRYENEKMADRLWEASEGEERASGLFDQLGDLVVICDARRLILDANEAFCAAVGDSIDKLKGRTLKSAGVDMSKVRGRSVSMPVDVKIGDRWFSWIEFPTTVQHGDGKAFRAVARDIHERKAGEAQLIESRERAEAANRAKSRFLATVSHEIRTPLNGINGMAKLLADTQLTAEQRTYVQAVTASGSALMTLIEDLLDFSKIETGKFDLRPETIEIRPFCESLVELMAARAHGKGIGIAAHIDHDVPQSIVSDPNRLRQALLNLLGNAVKFTDAGGVSLSVAAAQGSICFKIKDSGRGVDPSDRQRIFEEFEQVETGTTRSHGGVGLGLAITRKLVDAMGGELALASEPGNGSEFSVSIPHLAGRHYAGKQKLTNVNCDLLLTNVIEADALAATISSHGGNAALLKRAAIDPQPQKTLLIDFKSAAALDSHDVVAGYGRRIILIEPGERGELERMRGFGYETYLVRPVRSASLVRVIAGNPNDRRQGSANNSTDMTKQGGARRLSILVAEDNEINALLVRSALTKAGHSVTVVGDGRSAVTEMNRPKSDHDVVLMDLHMPVMDGLDAIAAIRTSEDEKGRGPVPILALTADGQIEVAQAVRAVGGDGLITKPVDPARLVLMVEEAAAA